MLNQSYLGKYNFLFVVLDSCRYDSFKEAHTPNIDRYGEARLTNAPAYFTLPSHVAMFRGNLPSNPKLKGYYNRRDFIMFRFGGNMLNPLHDRKVGIDFDASQVADLPDGFRQAGYHTIGIGGVHWFHPAYKTGKCIYYFFEDYWYKEELVNVDNPESLKHQVAKIGELCAKDKRKKFVFLNVSVTHIPYVIGRKFGLKAGDRRSQVKGVEHFDEMFPQLIAKVPKPVFVIITADHGDCFGEDGLWGHPQDHPILHKVPMVVFESNE